MYISIKPIYIEKIANHTKMYEFRNFIPKHKVSKLYIYVTKPTCELKYILEISDIIKYPEKLDLNGDGNILFNQGNFYKCAYKISKVSKLNKGIKLNILKEKYGFTPPQGFAYEDRYIKLTKDIEESEKELIWEI